VLRIGVNLFWMAFLADGLLSLLDEVLSWQAGFSPLTVLRSLLTFLVLVFSLVMAGVMVLTPRAPVRLVLPMILYCWWVGPGMTFPLGMVPSSGLPLAVAAIQILLAVWLWVRRRGRGWQGFPFAVNAGRPFFAWRHALLTGPVVLLAAMTFAVISVCSGLAAEIETFSGGYIRLRADGIYLLERKFQSADREVRLTGMMHIAQGDFYSGVLPEADPALPSIVLVEGVTDHQGLLSQGALRYTKVARLFKATSQEESEFNHHVMNGLQEDDEVPGTGEDHLARDPGPAVPVVAGKDPEGQVEPQKSTGFDFRHADVDIESFHPTTIAFLVAVVGVIQSDDLRSVVRSLADPSSPLSDEKAQVIVMQDILHSRNDRLRSEIQASLRDYRRVIVPWGALHLAEIEAWLRTQNFEQSGEVERKALGFW